MGTVRLAWGSCTCRASLEAGNAWRWISPLNELQQGPRVSGSSRVWHSTVCLSTWDLLGVPSLKSEGEFVRAPWTDGSTLSLTARLRQRAVCSGLQAPRVQRRLRSDVTRPHGFGGASLPSAVNSAGLVKPGPSLSQNAQPHRPVCSLAESTSSAGSWGLAPRLLSACLPWRQTIAGWAGGCPRQFSRPCPDPRRSEMKAVRWTLPAAQELRFSLPWFRPDFPLPQAGFWHRPPTRASCRLRPCWGGS